jgi:HSP20 family molecular chaperone IbpA
VADSFVGGTSGSVPNPASTGIYVNYSHSIRSGGGGRIIHTINIETTRTVPWSVYETDGRIHAVAAVPVGIPREAIGVAITRTSIGLDVDTQLVDRSHTSLPAPVQPVPLSMSYNNGIVEFVFAVVDAAPSP